MEAIIAVCTLPLDLNILAAGAEEACAGTDEVHFTMTLVINNFVVDIEDDDIGKVDMRVITIGVLLAAYECIVAFAISIILHSGCGAADVFDGKFLGFLVALRYSIVAEDKAILGVITVCVFGIELALCILSDLVALSVEGVLIAYTADSVLVTDPCAAGITESGVNVANAVLLNVGSCLLAVTAMDINRIVSLSKADIVGAGAADISDIDLAYIGKHGHHTGYITLNKRLVNNACISKTFAGAGAGVVVYHNAVGTGRACVFLNSFTCKWIDGAGDNIIYGKPVGVHIGCFSVIF